MQRKISYSLVKVADCFDQEGRKIANITLRTTDGVDEAYASKRSDAKGTSSMTEELIRLSLCSYSVISSDDKTSVVAFTQPFEGFDKWSTKARNYVVAAWKRLATPDEGDLADFFASATEVE